MNFLKKNFTNSKESKICTGSKIKLYRGKIKKIEKNKILEK